MFGEIKGKIKNKSFSIIKIQTLNRFKTSKKHIYSQLEDFQPCYYDFQINYSNHSGGFYCDFQINYSNLIGKLIYCSIFIIYNFIILTQQHNAIIKRVCLKKIYNNVSLSFIYGHGVDFI